MTSKLEQPDHRPPGRPPRAAGTRARGGRTARRRKPRIYLCGPITGCNPEQMRDWRQRIRERWCHKCDFLDPTDQLIDPVDPPYEVVRRDLEAIERSDGVLANMWRESIGTAMGIVVARNKGKPVVVADPNRLRNAMLAWYSDAVVDSPERGIRALFDLLRDRQIDLVQKKGTTKPQPFDLSRLRESIRRACHAAGRDDLLVPVEVVPAVLERLRPTGPVGRRSVTTRAIREAVWEALATLEADPLRAAEVSGIRQAWEQHERMVKGLPPVPMRGGGDGITPASRPLDVPIACGKAHHCIWGTAISRLSDIPARPRRIFREICRFEGIARIRLTTSSGGSSQGPCCVELRASKNPGTIEGKCFDPSAKRGRLQMFQILVHDSNRTEAIREALVAHLGSLGLLRHRDS